MISPGQTAKGETVICAAMEDVQITGDEEYDRGEPVRLVATSGGKGLRFHLFALVRLFLMRMLVGNFFDEGEEGARVQARMVNKKVGG